VYALIDNTHDPINSIYWPSKAINLLSTAALKASNSNLLSSLQKSAIVVEVDTPTASVSRYSVNARKSFSDLIRVA
jgi:hypothetical protein